MDNATPLLALRLSELPLWRLIIALDDVERTVGPDSGTARALAHTIRQKMRQELSDPASKTEVGDGK